MQGSASMYDEATEQVSKVDVESNEAGKGWSRMPKPRFWN